VLLKILHNEGVLEDVTSMTFLKNFSSWGGLQGLVNFVIVFRLSHAFTKYWAAFTSTNDMLGDWSGAASSVVVFCRHTKESGDSVEVFLNTVVRLFSMLSACALQELSPRSSHKIWGLLTLNSEAIDSQSLATLDGSSNRLGLVYHWIQQMLVDNQQTGMLAAPPPIVGRAFAELSAGMSKFVDAKKHATNQFNFPYAQIIKWLLILYSALLPLMMVQWSDWVVGAFIFTFVQLFFTWSLSLITLILESPFDTSNPNCIDLFELQREMNSNLLLLMDPLTRCGPPKLEKRASKEYQDLEKRDTVHRAALKKEGWQLKSELVLKLQETEAFHEEVIDRLEKGCCCSKPAAPPGEIAVSGTYSAKRFGIVDGEKTAVLPVGIFGDRLIVAVPPARIVRRWRKCLLDVQGLNGFSCQVLIKSIQISDRHKLHKKQPDHWPAGEFQDFIVQCKDLVADVFHARSRWLPSIPLSKVSIRAELDVDEHILAAKAVDKNSLGIESMVKLKSYDLFCKQLTEFCDLDQEAAKNEWFRRKGLPNTYAHGLDNRGCVIIELDIEAFKKQLEAERAQTQRKENSLKELRQAIEDAKYAGQMKDLEACIKRAEQEADLLPMDEFAVAQNLLLKWRKVDPALQQAAELRDREKLQTAIKEARDVRLWNDTYKLAEKVLHELKCQDAMQALNAAKESCNLKDLESSILQLDLLGLREEKQKAEDLLLTWQRVDEALRQACYNGALQPLKIAIGEAKEVKLHNDRYDMASKVLFELERKEAIQGLHDAKVSKNVANLQDAIKNASSLGLHEESREASDLLSSLLNPDEPVLTPAYMVDAPKDMVQDGVPGDDCEEEAGAEDSRPILDRSTRISLSQKGLSQKDVTVDHAEKADIGQLPPDLDTKSVTIVDQVSMRSLQEDVIVDHVEKAGTGQLPLDPDKNSVTFVELVKSAGSGQSITIVDDVEKAGTGQLPPDLDKKSATVRGEEMTGVLPTLPGAADS